MINNKRSQLTIVGVFGIMIFLGVFAVLSGTIKDFAEQTIVNGNLTGTSAFLMANINLFIILGLIMSIFAMATYSYYQN